MASRSDFDHDGKVDTVKSTARRESRQDADATVIEFSAGAGHHERVVIPEAVRVHGVLDVDGDGRREMILIRHDSPGKDYRPRIEGVSYRNNTTLYSLLAIDAGRPTLVQSINATARHPYGFYESMTDVVRGGVVIERNRNDWTCADVDGDEARELVEIVADWGDPSGPRWRATAVAVRGSEARSICSGEGSLPRRETLESRDTLLELATVFRCDKE